MYILCVQIVTEHDDYYICSIPEKPNHYGGLTERLKGTDCKSVGASLRWFESNTLHHLHNNNKGLEGNGQYSAQRDKITNRILTTLLHQQ